MPHKDPEAAKRYRREHYRRNAKRINARSRCYRQRYEREHREQRTLDRFRRETGITVTVEEHRAMLEAQMGVCVTCGKPPATGKRFHIDHDHNTGRVRGLLCGACNRGLGMFYDSPDALRTAAAYLERSWAPETAALAPLFPQERGFVVARVKAAVLT